MCGIAGFIEKKGVTSDVNLKASLKRAINSMHSRGPDASDCVYFLNESGSAHIGLGHARLSILDTNTTANQPMADETGRYTIVFNGEIFNFRELKTQFLSHKTDWKTESDTEVLLNLWIYMGKECISHLNGFFAFALYDSTEKKMWLVRDRYGIKPLHVYEDENFLVFGSEMKAILCFPIIKAMDPLALRLYLSLHYVPTQLSIFQKVCKVQPGTYWSLDEKGSKSTGIYYSFPQIKSTREKKKISFNEAKTTLRQLLEESVKRRLVSDVPLGTFLSGGIDSTIITGLAAQHTQKLNTFSIGFADDPTYDETPFADIASRQFKTNHHTFSLKHTDFAENIVNLLNYIDEPFADSSSIALYILSQKTRQKVTVALSGDGGDELFAGYHKHRAESQYKQLSTFLPLFYAFRHLTALLPQGRSNGLFNTFRQINRFFQHAYSQPSTRYWKLCHFTPEEQVKLLLRRKGQEDETAYRFQQFKEMITYGIDESNTLNDVLGADCRLVLPGDMLTKVDLMSMANSLEVRVPFLDYTVVNYAFEIPEEYKLVRGEGKYILKEAFKDFLPPSLRYRKKTGFEVPLGKLFKHELSSLLDEIVFNREKLNFQDLFHTAAVFSLKDKLKYDGAHDVYLQVWTLLVFQNWYFRHLYQTTS